MKIVFLCVANSARSQMAEGLARRLLGPGVEVFSAGSQPTRVNPLATQAMREVGIDITSHASKGIADLDMAQMDLVITLCADEVCPIVPAGVEKRHWPFPDPADARKTSDEQLLLFRSVRDQIHRKLKEFLGELR